MTAGTEHALDVLFFGTYDEGLHPRVRVLREGLAARGAQVRVCNRPLGVDTAQRVRLASRPWLLPGFALHVLRTWLRLWRDGAGAAPDVVVVGYLGHLDVHLARRRFPRSTLVLDHMVSLSGTLADRRLGGGLLRRLASAIDRSALRAADIVVVDTDEHARGAALDARRPPVVVPVGAPDAWFAEPSPREGEPPSAVFFGLYTPLQGAAIIAEALARLAPGTLRATMIGGGQDRPAAERALAASSVEVTWLDWCPADELPGVVAGHDICLGIFGTTRKALDVVPNKVFQGAAAGCAIVTSDTGPQRAALGSAATFVPPGDPAALAAALEALASDPAALAEARGRAGARAASFRPGAVVDSLVGMLDDRGPGHGGPEPKPVMLPPNARLRWSEVARLFRQDRPGSVLELGCGRGGFGSRLAVGTRYVGVEPDETSQGLARAVLGDDRVVGSLDELDPDDRFDWLCSFEVLEHVEDDAGELSGWVERVAPGGRIVVSVPGQRKRYGAFDEAVGHLRRYDPADLRALLEGAGLTDVDVRGYGAGAGDVLEAGRNLLAGRLRAGDDAAERTAASARVFVFPAWLDVPIRIGMAPFTLLQRPFGRRGVGPGLVGTGIRR